MGLGRCETLQTRAYTGNATAAEPADFMEVA